MKKRGIALTMAIIVAFSLAACQATPDSEIVVGKDSDRMIEKAQESNDIAEGVSIADQLNISGLYEVSDEYYDGKLRLISESEISLPEADGMPVVRITSGEFDQDRVNALYDVLVGGAQMYVRSDQKTKAQLEKEVLSQKELINRIQSGYSFDGETPDLEQEKQKLEDLEQAYADAPEYIESIAADATLHEMQNGNGTEVQLAGQDSDGNSIQFYVKNNDDSKQASFDFYRSVALSENELYQIGPYVIEDGFLSEKASELVGMTVEEAKEQVEEFFLNIGEGDVAVSEMRIVYMVPDDFFNASYTSEEFYRLEEKAQIEKAEASALRGYIEFTCCRTINEIPVSSQSISFQTGVPEGEESPEYMREWPYETITVGISSRGIETVSWFCPLDLIETVTEHANLLSFDDIDDIFRQMFKVKYSEILGESFENGSLVYTGYDITQISLTLRRIREQNSMETGYIIPVWDFYGTETIEYQNEPKQTISSNEPLLTINAIDGSVIDLSKGY